MEWKRREDREFLGPVPSAIREFRKNFRSIRTGKEIWRQISIDKNPPAAVKSVSEVINLNHWSRHPPPVFRTPGERVQIRVNRPCRSAAVVKVNGAQVNERAESVLPGELCNRKCNIGI